MFGHSLHMLILLRPSEITHAGLHECWVLFAWRLVLCLLCILAVHAYFVIEQPRQFQFMQIKYDELCMHKMLHDQNVARQSILFEYFRWKWLQEKICYDPWVAFNLDCKMKWSETKLSTPKTGCFCDKVYETSWWMMVYGADTPKRLKAISNWPSVVHLNTGTMARQQMREQTKYQTARSFLSTCVLDCFLLIAWCLQWLCMFTLLWFLRKEWKELVWKFEFKEDTVTHMHEYIHII